MEGIKFRLRGNWALHGAKIRHNTIATAERVSKTGERTERSSRDKRHRVQKRPRSHLQPGNITLGRHEVRSCKLIEDGKERVEKEKFERGRLRDKGREMLTVLVALHGDVRLRGACGSREQGHGQDPGRGSHGGGRSNLVPGSFSEGFVRSDALSSPAHQAKSCRFTDDLVCLCAGAGCGVSVAKNKNAPSLPPLARVHTS